MSPQAESVLAAGAGALVVAVAFRSLARTAVRRQILAGISQLDERLDRDRDQAITAMPVQARAAIEAEVGRALTEYHITPAQVQSLVRAVQQVGAYLPAEITRRLSA